MASLEAPDIGVGELSHDVPLHFEFFVVFCSFEFGLPTQVLILVAVTRSQSPPLLYVHVLLVVHHSGTPAQQVLQHNQKIRRFACLVQYLCEYLD